MRKSGLLLLAAFSFVSFQASGEYYSGKCEYMRFDNQDSYSGRCRIASSTDAQGHYIEEVQAGKFKIKIVLEERQGVWSRISFNGKPGMGFETNRTMFHYSPMDLSAILEISDP